MRNQPMTLARVVRDIYPENIGRVVIVLKRARPDDFVGGSLNDWICTPANRMQLFKSATNVSGTEYALTNGRFGMADADLEPLADLMGRAK